MPNYVLGILQTLSIILLMILITFIVTPFAIWIDYVEEKHKQQNTDNSVEKDEEVNIEEKRDGIHEQ